MLKAEPLTYEKTVGYGSTSTYKSSDGYGVNNVLRPVITLKKISLDEYIEEFMSHSQSSSSSTGSNNIEINDKIQNEYSTNEIKDDGKDNLDNNKESKTVISDIVKVSNTLLNSKIYSIVIGLLLIGTSITTVVMLVKKKI